MQDSEWKEPKALAVDLERNIDGSGDGILDCISFGWQIRA